MTHTAPGTRNLLSVDLDAIAHNLAQLKALLPSGSEVAGVVKADAYGHGLLPVAQRLSAEGVAALAVAEVNEGAHLRQAGLEESILVLVDPGPEEAAEAVRWKLTPFVGRTDTLEALSAAARQASRPAPLHLKLDSGMSRLGLLPEEVPQFLDLCRDLPGLELLGLSSHLATSGEPGDAFVDQQARVYLEVLQAARQRGFDLPDSSFLNSGGVLVQPEGVMQAAKLVRTGISLYGGLPSPGAMGRVELREAMRMSSRLAAVRPCKEGCGVSYGLSWQAPRDTWLGVVPAGYADGYPRLVSNRAQMLVNGKRVPLRGRVCMNLTLIDLGGLDPLPKAGDEVVLMGSQGDEYISGDELAAWAETINYEIYLSLGNANKRHYLGRVA